MLNMSYMPDPEEFIDPWATEEKEWEELKKMQEEEKRAMKFYDKLFGKSSLFSDDEEW